jgi:DNA primase
MLRATRSAADKGVELRMVEMPAGNDPADMLAAGGADDFRRRLDGALAMIQFQVRRVLADADLETPAGRDRALDEARGLIAAAPERTAMRDELVREVADRLDVSPDYVYAKSGPSRSVDRMRVETSVQPAGSSAGDVALRAEREFLVQCLAGGELGRSYLSQPTDAHFSFETTRRAREHLAGHFDDPLAGLSDEEPELAALVNGIVHDAGERPPSQEPVLRMSILQLEERRILRAIRSARRDDHTRQSELASAFQRVRVELDTVMGQTA